MLCFKDLLCYPILPTVYSDALSYYETICELSKTIQDVIAKMDTYGDTVLAEAARYTDTRVNAVYSWVNDRFGEYNSQWGDQIKDLQKQYSQLLINYNKLVDLFNQNIKFLDAKFDLLADSLKKYIKNVVSTCNKINVINPTNKKYEGLQKTLDDMYKALNCGSITAEEYDNLNLTARFYDKLRLTATYYDYNARFALFKQLYLTMRSPFTGLRETYDTIINQLAQLHQHSLTSSEYDNLRLTVTNYDSKTISAYNYDWDGKTYLTT